MPTATARAETQLARSAPPAARVSGGAFASVEVFDSVEAARGAFAELQGRASPYQDPDFAESWALTVGAASHVRPLIAVARDGAGAAVALLPLGAYRRGPFRVASFLGGRLANFHMGLFRAGLDWTREDVEALLRETAKRSPVRIHAFVFSNQPPHWRGAENPLARLDGRPSPSFAHSSALPTAFAVWRDAHFSKNAQKKLRKKAAHLQAIGPLAHRRAADPEDARALLTAFLDQKRARMRSLGLANEFDDAPTVAFLDALASAAPGDSAPPILELHALTVGERIVATFGGVADDHRLSGLMLSYDIDPAIAPSSPGELLVIEVVRDAIARGLAAFDLGVGEARYKDECCETVEPLFDSAFAVSAAGRLAARVFLLKQQLKRRVKRSVRLYDWARRLRRVVG